MKIKAILATIAVALMTMSVSAQKINYVDASTLNICGYTLKSESKPYARFDHTRYAVPNKHIEGTITLKAFLWLLYQSFISLSLTLGTTSLNTGA